MKILTTKKVTPGNSVICISLMLISISLFTFSCKRNCDYCQPTCNMFQDYESDSIGSAGNWQGVATTIGVENHSGSNKLRLDDGSGASSAYNEKDFPENLDSAGCELSYDVEYDAGSSANGTTAANSLIIYQGTFGSFTSRASFVLTAPHLIVSGAAVQTIKVPLSLASGSALPSNAYGHWVLVGGATIPTAADIANFNQLIQNISGVYFFVDNGSFIGEIWWYDNFCFTQCCP